MPNLLTKPDRKIRIWSAGCSTGEEPYSLAITLLNNMPNIDRWDVKILATDLDSNVLEIAKAGIYPVNRLEKISDTMIRKWFHESSTQKHNDCVKVKDKVKSLITFNRLNLMDKWPMKGPFDVIFCRNVVIYFDKKTQSVLFDRFSKLQYSGARLFVGHSENLAKVTDKYEHVGQTGYVKI